MLNQLFLLCNFIILVALLIYMWLQYGLSYVQAEQQLAEKKDFERKKYCDELSDEYIAVDKKIFSEMLRRKKLLQNMSKWFDIVKQEKIQKNIDLERRRERMCVLMRKQSAQIQARCAQKRIIPLAVYQVEQELIDLYQRDTFKARQFVQDICKSVQEEVQ